MKFRAKFKVLLQIQFLFVIVIKITLMCYYDQIFTPLFFRFIAQNSTEN